MKENANKSPESQKDGWYKNRPILNTLVRSQEDILSYVALAILAWVLLSVLVVQASTAVIDYFRIEAQAADVLILAFGLPGLFVLIQAVQTYHYRGSPTYVHHLMRILKAKNAPLPEKKKGENLNHDLIESIYWSAVSAIRRGMDFDLSNRTDEVFDALLKKEVKDLPSDLTLDKIFDALDLEIQSARSSLSSNMHWMPYDHLASEYLQAFDGQRPSRRDWMRFFLKAYAEIDKEIRESQEYQESEPTHLRFGHWIKALDWKGIVKTALSLLLLGFLYWVLKTILDIDLPG